MILENIIIGCLTYYITIFVIVYKCSFKSMFKNLLPPPSAGDQTVSPPIPPPPDDLITKSNFKWQESEPPPETPPDYNEEEEEEKPEEEEEEEEEDLSLGGLNGKEKGDSSGVTFDELAEIITTLKKDNSSEKEEGKIAVPLEKMQNCNLLQTIAAQIPKGAEKVDAILKRHFEKYQMEQSANTDTSETDEIINKEKLQTFNMNDYVPEA